jgi:hypothetical protein
MTSRPLLRLLGIGWTGIAIALLGGSCTRDPENFCDGWASDTCEVMSTCCEEGSKFDMQTCRIGKTEECHKLVQVERVHSGEVSFSSSAASDCLPEITACADLRKVQDESFDSLKACANMLTGFRRTGAACNSSTQCEKVGEFSLCYEGVNGQAEGICVEAVLGETGCSFSFDTLELHLCPDGKFCDLANFQPKEGTAPSSRAYEFKAKCVSKLGIGAVCLDKDDGSQRPCKSGLFCDFAGEEPTCQARKGEGEPCNFSDEECSPGLTCRSEGFQQTCQKPKGGGLFCFAPNACGDGLCAEEEDAQTCPADCGGGCLSNGSFCEFDEECCDFFCSGNTCGGGGCAPSGSFCEFDDECCNFFCSGNFCGGGFCGSTGDFCDFDEDCCDFFCDGGICFGEDF